MKKLLVLLLAIAMLVSVVAMSIGAIEASGNEVVQAEQGNVACECGGAYGAWTYPVGAACVGSRYYRECDSCDNVQTAKDITPKTISYTVPAIGANEGDVVMLSLYSVYFTASEVKAAEDITWSSDAIAIVDGCIYPTTKGTYELTATVGSTSKKVYLVVKKETESEYVLFYDDFERDASVEDSEGKYYLPTAGNAGYNDYEIIQQPSGTNAYTKGGFLVLDCMGNNANQMRVILPKWIGDFGDYKIDTVFTIKQTVDDNSRWFATMARVANDSDYFPIWQAAIRQGAKSHSSGVEISYTGNGTKWEVPCKSKYTTDIDPKTYYTQTFEMVGTVAYHSINGTAIQNTIGKSKQPTEGIGLVGFHLRASEVSVDSIKIVVPIDDSIHDFGAWETVTGATCTTNGLEKRTCSICNTTEERAVAATGHSYGDWVVVVAPGCTTKGKDQQTCTTCGAVNERSTNAAHTLVSYSAKAPTCTEGGYRSYEACEKCDYTTFSGNVAALGHYFDREIKCIAHRGYSSTAPENTLAAYRLARQLGFLYAECDVSFTKDSVAVLLHDTTIDRTSNGSGAIADLTYEELLQYDFGSWKSSAYAGEKIPTFEEFIALCKEIGLHPYIEIKNDGETYTQEQVQALVAIVEKYDMQDNCTWISFNLDYLAYVKNADSTARLGYVSSKTITQSMINSVLALKTDENEVFLDISYNMLNENNVMLAALNGIPLETWTVDSTNEIKNRPKYISGYTSNKLVATDTLVKTAITAPTCNAQGYTTYTCSCGATKVADYEEPTGEHTAENGVCTVCGVDVYCSDASHNLQIVGITYQNGYDKVGVKVVKCLDCDAKETEIEAPALFTCKGYSSPTGDRVGVAVGFEVNKNAVAEFERVTGKSVRYGAFAVAEGTVQGNTIFDENGNAIAGAIFADITEQFDKFDIMIVGFEESQKDLLFAMGAYVAVVGDTTEYSYIQKEAPAENDIYSFTSYNAIVNSKEEEEA